MLIAVTTVLKVIVPFLAGAIVHAIHKSSVKEVAQRLHIRERTAIEQRVRNESLRKTLLHLDDLVAHVGSEMFQSLMDALEDGKISQEERAQLLDTFLQKVSQFFGQRIGSNVEERVKSRSATSGGETPTLPNTGIRLNPPKLD